MKAKSLRQWINNPSSLNSLIKKELFPRSFDPIDSWTFSNETSPYSGINNYLNFVWAFMHTHNGVVYDCVDYENEPGDQASMCGINTGLKAKREFGGDYIFMVFSRHDNKWMIEGFRARGHDHDSYESKLHLSTCRLVLPKMYKKPIPEEVIVDKIMEYHFYENRHRATTRFRNSIIDYTGGEEGKASQVCNWLIRQRIQKENNGSGPFKIDPIPLQEIWFASGAQNEQCANPRFDLVYPIFDQNKTELDGCLCLNRRKNKGRIQEMKAKTLFSPKMAYRDALVLCSHSELNSPSSWLSKENVEKSIENGCEDY